MDLSRWNNLNQNNSFLLVVVVTESRVSDFTRTIMSNININRKNNSKLKYNHYRRFSVTIVCRKSVHQHVYPSEKVVFN